MPHSASIAIIGAGNMTASLIGGLCVSGYSPTSIHVSNPSQEKLQKLAHLYGVRTYSHNIETIQNADVVVLSVKPWVIETVSKEIAPIVLKNRPLIISIATGIALKQFAHYFSEDTAIIRAMPNIASQILQGATGLYANAKATAAQREVAEQVFKSVGMTVWLDSEEQLHAITALSGSGIAYYFLMMEAIAQAGVKLGLPPEVANILSTQTALGAAKMVTETGLSFEELRNKVAVPKGTTVQALAVMENQNIRGIMQEALEAAYKRSIELSQQ